MKKMRFFSLLVLALLALTVAACEFSFSTANVKSATLARDYRNGEAVDPTTVFDQTDQVLHLVVKVANAPDDTKLKASWQVVEVEGYEPSVIDESEMAIGSGEDTFDFTLANDQAWPAGKYKVDLYLNDELNQSLEFQVQ